MGRQPKKVRLGFQKMLAEILSLPTAPFHEDAVIGFVRRTLRRMGVSYRQDRHGNLIAHARGGAGRRGLRPPLAMVAHMDHPGFVIEKIKSPTSLSARVLGGVGGNLVGRKIRFQTLPACQGKIVRVEKKDSEGRPVRVLVRCSGRLPPAPAGSFGMWDIPVFSRRAGKIYARAIDDVLGVAVMLEVLRRLRAIAGRDSASGAPSAGVSGAGRDLNLYCCFTRAEEVGFIGAAAMAKDRILPAGTRVISIEMSKALAGRAEQGKGFVVRVGDRATMFDPQLCEFMIYRARKILAARPDFRFQISVLDGGVCEATLFNAMGYRAAGVALPLGNYHNRTSSMGVGPEYIDERDLSGLVDFLTDIAGKIEPWDIREKRFRARLEKNFKKWKRWFRPPARRRR